MSGRPRSVRLNDRFVVVGRWVLSTGSGVADVVVAGGFDDRSAFVVGSTARFESALTCSFGCCFVEFDRLIDRFARSSDCFGQFDCFDRFDLFGRLFDRFDRSDCSTDHSDLPR